MKQEMWRGRLRPDGSDQAVKAAMAGRKIEALKSRRQGPGKGRTGPVQEFWYGQASSTFSHTSKDGRFMGTGEKESIAVGSIKGNWGGNQAEGGIGGLRSSA